MKLSKIKLSTKEQVVFLKQLGLLLQGGISIIESLRSIGHYGKNKQRSLLIAALIREVEQGRPLFQALGMFPKSYSPVVISTVEIGELSGTLAQSLLSTANELQNSN